jgi:hypothetical protein
MIELEKLYEQSVVDVRDALNRIATLAYDAGRADENAHIMDYLTEQADKFEATRPPSEEGVVTTMDVRIHTIRKIVEYLELKGIENE